jgi:hypothetical protein
MCDTTFAHNAQCHEAKDMYVMGVTVFGNGPFEQSQVRPHVFCLSHHFFLNDRFFECIKKWFVLVLLVKNY